MRTTNIPEVTNNKITNFPMTTEMEVRYKLSHPTPLGKFMGCLGYFCGALFIRIYDPICDLKDYLFHKKNSKNNIHELSR